MEPEEKKGEKKLNDDLVVFMRKRSETEEPRYTARLKTYVDFQQKRRRAAAARRHSDRHTDKRSLSKKKLEGDQKNKAELGEQQAGDPDDDALRRGRVRSLSRSSRLIEDQQSDKCGRRRRRRRRRRSCGRRRRRRSRCRRRRRRSRCRRRRRSRCRRRRRSRCRRRHRRSCSRRRRRRSCRRRRKCRR